MPGGSAEGILRASVTMLHTGDRVGPYEILDRVGAGGMGEVYRARDTRLQRTVAIKLIRSEHAGDPDFRDRFQREARAISALNHPHICSLYDIGEHQGVDYLVMEYVEGHTLAEVLTKGPLPVELALRYGVEIANALVAVHARGIIHRDLKPGNVMVTESGVKVLDFGLTKRTEPAHLLDAVTVTAEPATHRGHVVGTVEYMSPEQAEGRALDPRSDIFSFGVLLYEMLCGQRPFHGESTLSTLASILREAPTPVRSLRPGISEEVDRIVSRCLAKRAEDRYETAGDLEQDLKQLIREPSSGLRVSRPLVVTAAALIVVAVGAVGTWQYSRDSRVRWAENEALPQAEQLLEHDQPLAAMKLLREVESQAPTASGLSRLKEDIHFRPRNIQTEPAGADIYVVDYTDPKAGDPDHWEYVGKSPVGNLLLPQRTQVRLRVVKDTFEPLEFAYFPVGNLPPVQLKTRQDTPSTPSAMVWLPQGGALNPIGLNLPLPTSPAWIDKYEVTNRAFKTFVDAGGYQKREYWTHPFVKDGKALTFEEALVYLRDMTGSPGPSTWEGGTYPDGMDDYPVSGVSWYEAAAYAEFAHKSLPTVSHWYVAAGLGASSQIVQMSNFTGKGPAKAGDYLGLTARGTFDQVGNVKEWVLNATGDKRFILGGGWNETSYMHAIADARGPFERDSTFGFRCAVYVGAVSGALTASLPAPGLDESRQPPVDDRTFALFKSQLSYDKTDLNARVESVDDAPHWRRENISFRAPYGGR